MLAKTFGNVIENQFNNIHWTAVTKSKADKI